MLVDAAHRMLMIPSLKHTYRSFPQVESLLQPNRMLLKTPAGICYIILCTISACAMEPPPRPPSSNKIHLDWDALSARTPEGLAPLYGLDSSDRIPDEYIVSFFRSHDFEAHCAVIGRDAARFPNFRKYSFGYRAIFRVEDMALLDLVRSDAGVRWVDTNVRVHPCASEVIERREL